MHVGLQNKSLPQLAVRAMKEGVVARTRWSRPAMGAPSEPLKDEPEPDTQRYFVETVWDRSRWNNEIVEPWLMQTTMNCKYCGGQEKKRPTFKVFGTLSLFTGFADDLDWPTREDANDAFDFIVQRGRDDFGEGFNFFLFFVNIRDEELLPDATTDVGCPWRSVIYVE